jgi:uncharacterized membrane protein YgdD (TMEM256/DUF423 family)
VTHITHCTTHAHMASQRSSAQRCHWWKTALNVLMLQALLLLLLLLPPPPFLPPLPLLLLLLCIGQPKARGISG